ncbi:sensor histidine kinase [Paenibacillus gansuensis]|uniref:histidine kinase n=1 Tax=Paenibacillus gansuensis TaxID=306542 RepID=A0ABW5P9B8_9BACL
MEHFIVRSVFVSFLCTFIGVSSIWMNKASSVPAVIAFGIAFCLSMGLSGKYSKLSWFQLPLLAGFHWFAELNWCFVLYFIIIAYAIMKKPSLSYTISMSAAAISVYSCVRLYYQPVTEYNVLVTVQDLMSVAAFVLLVHYVLGSEREKQRLASEKEFLITHDPLTGLLNYEGYISRVEELMIARTPFVLVLLDFQDFKSVNTESISTGNETLTNISNLLRRLFPDYYAVSRYAGDRFAILIPPRGEMSAVLTDKLESGRLGYQVTYSFGEFPRESAVKEELISLVEERLFQGKRNVWIHREEELFRSEKMKVVGELAAGMAHEIRNPLTTIKGFMQIASQNDFNVRPWFDIIMGEITRMNELTAEFLQFSKPHISNMKPEPLEECIHRVLSLTESDALFRGHRILVQPAMESIYIYTDRDKMVQVLLNLIQNAYEAMQQPGEVYVRVAKEEYVVRIEIEDTGPGIPEEELKEIFNPFYTTKETGTGLGLSICQKIVQDHNGVIDVKSTLNRGSIFSIFLPVYVAGQPEQETATNTPEKQANFA